MSAAQIGKALGLSQSTVLRFARTLGYESFPDFQRHIQEYLQSKLSALDRVRQAGTLHLTSRTPHAELLEKVFDLAVQDLRGTEQMLSVADFSHAVQLITRAQRVFVVGMLSSAGVASYLAFNLNLRFGNTTLVTDLHGTPLERIARVGKGDVVVCVSFPRYNRSTVETAEWSAGQGADIILITDTARNPIAAHARAILLCRDTSYSFTNAYVTALTVSDAIITAIAIADPDETIRALEFMERLRAHFRLGVDLAGC